MTMPSTSYFDLRSMQQLSTFDAIQVSPCLITRLEEYKRYLASSIVPLSLRPASCRDSSINPHTSARAHNLTKAYFYCPPLVVAAATAVHTTARGSGLGAFEAAKAAPKKALAATAAKQVTCTAPFAATGILQRWPSPCALHQSPVNPSRWRISPASLLLLGLPDPPEEPARTLAEALDSGLDSLKAAGGPSGGLGLWRGLPRTRWARDASVQYLVLQGHHPAVVIPEMRSKIPRAISTIADRRRRALGGILSLLCSCYFLLPRLTMA
ncbi:hypothetical protein BBK36DRAFT_1174874 [Trichoderma citrinoviride]|uniref:Uncharacterized protein n=1 Tax=Trichoderma citrinoviride TaxID=58853 RepID=A0A2T4BMS2_9HYPO|nr:hypothetical protein BBK36DRAFT_1174874 [Trichoderma citrinoviride]PTB70603.1 hypothetical protein BBK36DRAFT_1174874 [Trichoderma citrinoviride]